MHIVIFPTWQCQLKCAYCWLPHVKINRAAPLHTWQEWANALLDILPWGATVDISGGDPFMFPNVEQLAKALGLNGINWALGTNALDTAGVDRLIAAKPPRCVCVNVSDHAGNKLANENVEKLRGAFHVTTHRVDHKAAGHHLDNTNLIPYQDWKNGTALDGVRRVCTAGVNHWIADQAGDVWRCVVDMQVGNPPMANIFNRFSLPIALKNPLCEFGCSTCYTSEPHAWQIEMSEA